MTCLLDRETFRRWERWFNGVAGKAMPAHYEMRNYKNPYAKALKPLWPDPPPRKPKLEKGSKAPKPEAPPGLDEEEIEALQQAEWELQQVQKRVEDYVPYQSPREERAAREKATARHKRLQELWDKAELEAKRRAEGLDPVGGDG